MEAPMPRFNFTILHGYYAALVAMPAFAALFPLLAFASWGLMALMLAGWVLLYKERTSRDDAIANSVMAIILATEITTHLMLVGFTSLIAAFFIGSLFLVTAYMAHRDIQRYLNSRATPLDEPL